MTWSAFLVAMRRGISEKTGAAARRGGVQQRAANRSVSSQAVKKGPLKKTPPIESWDFMMLDVSLLIDRSFHFRPSEILTTCNRVFVLPVTALWRACTTTSVLTVIPAYKPCMLDRRNLKLS